MRKLLILLLLMAGQFEMLSAQAPLADKNQGNTVTLKSSHKRNPSTAALLSAILPGAGQVYNRKSWWWKVPIIYAAGGGMVYGVLFYQDNYNAFREAYKYRIQTPSNTNGIARFDRFETPTLKAIRDSYREARDQCAIGLILVYTLQVMDASVEAHLLEFNVNDDLSLRVQPVIVPYDKYTYAGIQLSLTLK